MQQFSADTTATQMLWAVAEQLKVPLSVIARRAELLAMHDTGATSASSDIRTQADAALRLVDSYLLGLELWKEQASLPLETVSLSSIVADTAQGLYRYARQYDVDLRVDVAGRYGPVMANTRGLQAAMLSMGYAMIESQAGPDRSRAVTLAVHRTKQGLVAGMYSTGCTFEAESWRQGRQLQGRAHQPHPSVNGSSAGLFVADTIMQAMDTALLTGKHGNQTGLRAVFTPSSQLTLV